jgi:hypothetical protein
MASSTYGSASAANPSSTQGTGNLRSEAGALVRQVNRLLNRQLSSVCQINGVKSTGIKAELQGRIHNRKFTVNLYTVLFSLATVPRDRGVYTLPRFFHSDSPSQAACTVANHGRFIV